MKLARTATLFSGGGTLEAGLLGFIEPVLAVIVGNGIPVPLTRAVIGPLLRSRAKSFHGREAPR